MSSVQSARPHSARNSGTTGIVPRSNCVETASCCKNLRDWIDWLQGIHINSRAYGSAQSQNSSGWENAYQEWFETELERCNSHWDEADTGNKWSGGAESSRKRIGTDSDRSSRKRTGTEGSSRSRRSAPPINGRSFDVSLVVDAQNLDSLLDSDSDCEGDELYEEPPEYLPPRRGAVSAEAYGIWNPRHSDFTPPYFRKTEQTALQICEILKECPFMSSVDEAALQTIVEALPMELLQTGDCIMRQGEHGDAAFIVLSGSADVYKEPPKQIVQTFFGEQEKGQVDDDDVGSEIFDGGCNESALGSPASHRSSPDSPSSRRGSDDAPFTFPSEQQLQVQDEQCASVDLEEREFVRTITTGRLFGEMSMLWRTRRTRSVYAREDCMLSKITREVFQNLVVRHNMSERSKREECLRQVTVFETLSDEQISQLADALEQKSFSEGEDIIRQGERGNEFFIVVSGECSVIVETGNLGEGLDVQEHGKLGANSLFGERALIDRTTRTATIRTTTPVEVFCLKRRSFERMLGPLCNLHLQHYLSDPRKCLADFFKPGGQEGPRASLFRGGGVSASQIAPKDRTDWFAVYRPTSRDAIAKMIGGTAVGKGLNVKGKSSKKNRLSGFVPFLQISDNEHKKEIEPSPPSARLSIFYSSPSGRSTALSVLQMWLPEDAQLEISTEREIYLLDDYQGLYGLEVPEVVMRKVYIEQPDLSPLAGWETGRKSEPAFMDMNLHAIRGKVEPEVVLYQHDADNPLNPHGLLIAYAEVMVKPVVSDFDTFTIGSKGMKYEALPAEQLRLAMWSLDHTLDILRSPGSDPWNSRWLEVLRKANEEGFHPHLPKYGFGDATSSKLIELVVEWTWATGAVRHGAESFNFYFPQELDEEFLIIWENFPDKPWAYKTESELRFFLLERVREGYSFPLNPVWPVRDKGWFDVFEALRESEDAAQPMQAWYPPDSGLLEKIDAIHAQFPDCFATVIEEVEVENPRKGLRSQKTTSDLDLCERADLGLYKLGLKARWRKTVKNNLRRLNSRYVLAEGGFENAFPLLPDSAGSSSTAISSNNSINAGSCIANESRPKDQRRGRCIKFDLPDDDHRCSVNGCLRSSASSILDCQTSNTALSHGGTSFQGARSVRFRSEGFGTVEENLDEDLSTIASAPDIYSLQVDENIAAFVLT